MEIGELIFRYNGFVVRLKEGFVRLDTSAGMEADDFFLDFSDKKDIITICNLIDSSKPSLNNDFIQDCLKNLDDFWMDAEGNLNYKQRCLGKIKQS